MPDQKLLEDIVRRLEEMNTRLHEVELRKHLFEILNQNTPPQLTADVNNYDPGNYDLLRLTSNAAWNISGLSGGITGRILILGNLGTFNITLLNNSGASLVGNRFSCPGHTNVVMTPLSTGTNSYVMLQYGGNFWNVIFKTAP